MDVQGHRGILKAPREIPGSGEYTGLGQGGLTCNYRLDHGFFPPTLWEKEELVKMVSRGESAIQGSKLKISMGFSCMLFETLMKGLSVNGATLPLNPMACLGYQRWDSITRVELGIRAAQASCHSLTQQHRVARHCVWNSLAPLWGAQLPCVLVSESLRHGVVSVGLTSSVCFG